MSTASSTRTTRSSSWCNHGLDALFPGRGVNCTQQQQQQEEGNAFDRGEESSSSSSSANDGLPPNPPFVDYGRMVREAIAASSSSGGGGRRAVRTDSSRSRVVRVSDADGGGNGVRVGEILSMLSQPSRGSPHSFIAALMAVMDFNDRKSTFVTNLQELTEGCDFYLDIRYRAPQYWPVADGRIFQEEFLLSDDDDDDDATGRFQSMSILGPSRSVEAEIVAKMGGSIPNDDNDEDEDPRSPSEGGGRQVSERAIPNIATSATSAELENRVQYPFFARTTPTDRAKAFALCYYLQSIGVRRMAALHVNDSYGRAYVMGLREAARRYDIRLLVASYHDGVDESLEGAIDRLRTANYTYHMMLPSSSELFWKPVVRKLVNASLIGVPDKMWFFGDSLGAFNRDHGEPDVARALNRTAGVYLAKTQEQTAAMDAALTDFLDNDQLMEYFLSKQVSGPLSDIHNVTHFRSIYNETREAPLATLLTYDAVAALGIAACQTPGEFFSGPELYDTLKGVRFVGASGEVTFDNVTATRPFTNASVWNVFVEPNTTISTNGIQSMVIDPANGRIQTLEPLLFADGSTDPPPSLNPVVEDMNLLSWGERAACWALAGIVLICAACCAVWTAVNRDKPSVKASQPTFLFVLAVGAFILAGSIIPVTFQEPMPTSVLDAGCMSTIFLASIGFSTAFGGLFAKTWRIHRVFKESRRGRRIQIQVHHVMIPVVVLLTTNVLILTIWTIVSPLRWSRIVTDTDSFGRTTSSIGTCMRLSEPAQIAFFFLTIGVNFVALCLSNWMTYQARNLPAQFNDNPFTGIANMVLLECAIIGAPILFVTAGDPSSFVVVNSLLLAIISAATLLPVVLPFALKPRMHEKRWINSVTSKNFDADKARCHVGNYPASAPQEQHVFGSRQVRVSGLGLNQTTTQHSTSLRGSGLNSHLQIVSSQFSQYRNSGGTGTGIVGGATARSSYSQSTEFFSPESSGHYLTKARRGRSFDQTSTTPNEEESKDLAIRKATVNHEVRSRAGS